MSNYYQDISLTPIKSEDMQDNVLCTSSAAIPILPPLVPYSPSPAVEDPGHSSNNNTLSKTPAQDLNLNSNGSKSSNANSNSRSKSIVKLVTNKKAHQPSRTIGTLSVTPKDAPLAANTIRVPLEKCTPAPQPTPSNSNIPDDTVVPPSSPSDSFLLSILDEFEKEVGLKHDDAQPARKKHRWEPVSAHFDASLLCSANAPRDNSAAQLPPLVPNGAALDAQLALDLTVEDRYCLVLTQLLLHADPTYIKEYHLANDLPRLVDVTVFPSSAKALLFYARQFDWEEARFHNWAIGVVDTVAAENPLGDHGAYFRITFSVGSCHIKDFLQEIGAALAAFNIKVIAANRSANNSKFIIVYLAALEDYVRALQLVEDVLVASPSGEITILTLMLDMAVCTHRTVKRLYIGNLPSMACEFKTLALLRTSASSLGFKSEDVIAFNLHKLTGNIRSSYGFAQVVGQNLASALCSASVGAKGAALAISFATKSAKKSEK